MKNFARGRRDFKVFQELVETLEDWGTFDTEACRDKAVHQTFQIGACSSPSSWLTTPACVEVMEKEVSLW